VTDAALAGAHIATVPFKVLQQMVHHPLTDKGIVTFRDDWEKARASVAAKGGGDGTASGGAATAATLAATHSGAKTSSRSRPSGRS
jgi:hypothetical protein